MCYQTRRIKSISLTISMTSLDSKVKPDLWHLKQAKPDLFWRLFGDPQNRVVPSVKWSFFDLVSFMVTFIFQENDSSSLSI